LVFEVADAQLDDGVLTVLGLDEFEPRYGEVNSPPGRLAPSSDRDRARIRGDGAI